MNKTLQGVVALGSGLALVVALLGFFRPLTVNVSPADVRVNPIVGATAGTDHVQAETFRSAIGFGGRTDIGATTGVTLTASQVCDNGVLSIFPTDNTTNVTLPSGTDLINQCLREAGAHKYVTFLNTNTIATSTFTFVSSTGLRLKVVGSTSTANTVTVSTTAMVDFVHIGSSTVNALLQVFKQN